METAYHPALGRQVNYSVEPVPEDADGQVAAVIGIMTDYARADASSPEIARDLESIVAHPHADYSNLPAEEARERTWIDSIWYHVHNRVTRFVSDEETAEPIQPQYGDSPIVETLIRPRDMALYCDSGNCQGDCDDYAMYAASLLVAMGIRCAFVTVAADETDKHWFSHVYVAAYTASGARVALDCSHGEYAGWEVARYWRIEEWPVTRQARFLPYVVAAALFAWCLWQWKRFTSEAKPLGLVED
jgi:hypothetical protein